MGRKERSVSALSLASIIAVCMVLLIATPVIAGSVMDGDGIRWRSSDLYRAPVGMDEDGNVYVMIDTMGDPVRTGDPRLVSLDVNGTKRWEYQVHGYGYNAIVDRGGRVYLLESIDVNTFEYGKERTLTILDQNGSKSLSLDLFSRHNESDRFKLFYAGDNVLYYAATTPYPDGRSELCAIDMNGTELWSLELRGTALSASPLSGMNMLASTDKGAYIIDDQGSIARSVNMTDERILAAPSLSPNGTMYLAVHRGDMYQPNEIWAIGADGGRMWSESVIPGIDYAMDCMVVDILVSSGGTLYAATTGGTETGVPIASYSPLNSTTSKNSWIPPRLLAFDENGQLVWKYDLEGDLRGQLAEIDGKIVACASNGILVFSPEGAVAERYIPPSGYLMGMVLAEEGRFCFTHFTNSGGELVFSNGMPRVTVIDWMSANEITIALLSIGLVLAVSVFILRRFRRMGK